MLQEFSIVRAGTEGYKELAYPLGKKNRKEYHSTGGCPGRGGIVNKVLALRRSR